jgi:hypothetical protein
VSSVDGEILKPAKYFTLLEEQACLSLKDVDRAANASHRHFATTISPGKIASQSFFNSRGKQLCNEIRKVVNVAVYKGAKSALKPGKV